jgi:hypothetical protein
MFNVDQLSEQYRNLEGNKIAVRNIKEAKTADALIASNNYQANVQGKAPVLKMSTESTLQAAGCGFNPMGSTTFSEKYLEVAKLQIAKSHCYSDLESTYVGHMLKNGDNPETDVLPVEITNQLIDMEVKQAAMKVERLIWSGDKASQTADLKHIDGIRKQLTAVTATVVTGDSIIEKLIALYQAMPEETRDSEDAYVFMSPAMATEYRIAVWSKGNYHADAVDKVAAVGIKIFETPGLTGTREVYATTLSNFQLGFGGTTDAAFKLWFSEDDQVFKQLASFSVGVTVIFPEDVRKAVL